MTCEPSELAELAKCFVCLDEVQSDAIEIYLLCVWENTVNGE